MDCETRILQQSEVKNLLMVACDTPKTSFFISSEWSNRWHSVNQLVGSHYFLPTGAVGRHYVAMPTEEIKLLTISTNSHL